MIIAAVALIGAATYAVTWEKKVEINLGRFRAQAKSFEGTYKVSAWGVAVALDVTEVEIRPVEDRVEIHVSCHLTGSNIPVFKKLDKQFEVVGSAGGIKRIGEALALKDVIIPAKSFLGFDVSPTIERIVEGERIYTLSPDEMEQIPSFVEPRGFTSEGDKLFLRVGIM
ncbi:MAG: hypothetical protein AAB390_00420 [Patescibacteria group bacterium]